LGGRAGVSRRAVATRGGEGKRWRGQAVFGRMASCGTCAWAARSEPLGGPAYEKAQRSGSSLLSTPLRGVCIVSGFLGVASGRRCRLTLKSG
jgi:hypothetical protein